MMNLEPRARKDKRSPYHLLLILAGVWAHIVLVLGTEFGVRLPNTDAS